MKKLLLIIISIMFSISFTACNDNKQNIKTKVNYISEAKLTDREKMFLSISSNEYFAFDFKVDDNYKEVEVWIEKYELGKKVSSTGAFSAKLLQRKDGMIVCTVSELEKFKTNWTLTIKDGGTIATIKPKQDYNLQFPLY